MDGLGVGSEDDHVRPCTVSWAAQLLQQFQQPPLDSTPVLHMPSPHPFGSPDTAQHPPAIPATYDSAESFVNENFPPQSSHVLPHHSSPTRPYAYTAIDATVAPPPLDPPTHSFGCPYAPAIAYSDSLDFANAASPPSRTSTSPSPFASAYPPADLSSTASFAPSWHCHPHHPAPAPFTPSSAQPTYTADSPLIDSSLAGFRLMPPSSSRHSYRQQSTSQYSTNGITDSQGASSSFASSQSSAPLFLLASPAPFPALDPELKVAAAQSSPVVYADASARPAQPGNEVEKVVGSDSSTCRPTRSGKRRARYLDDVEDVPSSQEDEADQADDGGEYRPSRKRTKPAPATTTSHRRQLSVSSTTSILSASTSATSPATSPVRTTSTSTRQPLHKPLEVIDVEDMEEWESETEFFGPWRMTEGMRVFDAHGNEVTLSPTINNPPSFTYDPTRAKWLTYRRNFLTLTISLHSRLALSTLRTSHSFSPIKHIEVGLTSATFPKGANAELLQLDVNRKLRDAVTLGRQVLEPTNVSTKMAEDRQQTDTSPSTAPHRYTTTFRRVQFRHSTANQPSIAVNATDKHFLVRCTLYAVHEDGSIVELGKWNSAMLIVRGRSPGNFGVAGKGKKKGQRKSSKTVGYGADTDTTDDDAPGEVVFDAGGNIVVLDSNSPLPSATKA
ncbi:hypothetical protein JCM10295v2_005975 [Rhodotorula toruloides]